MEVEEVTRSEWQDALPDGGFELFHLPAALDVLAAHAPGDLRLYAGYKGQQPVALFPVFVREAAVGRTITSPPPRMGVPRLGPIVMAQSPKQRKRERVNRRFVRGVLDDLGADASLALCRIVCPRTYHDPRPFQWTELDVRPSFTYVVDLDRPLEAVKAGFSGSLRKELRRLQDDDLAVEVGGVSTARRVYDDVSSRYADQDEPFGPSWPYVRDLVTALGDRARAYAAYDAGGAYLGGIVALFSDDAVYFWLGGARSDYEGDSVNTLLHWTIIRDAVDNPPGEPVRVYDLVGANVERLCRYKSKLGGDVVPYYVVETPGTGMDIAKRAFQLVRR